MSLLTPSKASTEAREERLAAAQEAKLREARAASDALKARSDEASETRKAAARQTIERLKARLQMLRSMAGMDPEGVARLAAQLARELGQAVKAYAAAGGNASGMSATGVAPAASAAVSGDAAGATDAGVQAATAEPVTAPETKTDPSASTGDEGKSSNPYQQAIDEQKAQAAEMSRRNGEKRADGEVMADVRRMAAELKGLIREATGKAKAGEDDALSPHEARELDDAAADLDRAIQQAGTDLGGGLVSLLI